MTDDATAAGAIAGDAESRPRAADEWATGAPYLPSLLLDAVRRHPDRPPPWIEPADGTLVLADISGFTALSERLAQLGKEGAERLTDIINANFARLLEIARDRGGGNLKFGGDALLLFFDGEEHAHRAVAAALAMQRAIREFGLIRVPGDPIRLSMSIGVHSARFWSAAAGTPELRMQHFVLGRAGSRLAETEAAASAGEVLLTDETRQQVEGLVTVQPHEGFFRAVRATRRRTTLPPASEDGPQFASFLEAGLLAFLPPPVAQALRGGDGRAGIEGEHRKVSIVFISLRGGNELLEKEGPDPVLHELQQYIATVVRLADRHGGFLAGNDIDSHGLKLWVLFGAPVAHEQDAANALRLAAALSRELGSLEIHLQHHIGVNSGFVFAGDVGWKHRRDYTIMGDAMNVAARLMSSAQPGQILISEQVWEDAGPGFIAPELPPIRVKGKTEPIAIRELHGEQAVLADDAAGLSELFGRDAEVEALQRLCIEAETDGGRSVIVSGDAGTGKSRLVLELEAYQRARGWRVLRGPSYEHTAATPFAPWILLLDGLFETDHTQSAEARSDRVVSTIERLRGDLLELAPLLNTLLTLAIPDNDLVRSLDDDSRRLRLFELIAGLLQAEAQSAPLSLLLEDIHWADGSSLQLIKHVAANLGEAPALVCLAHRPLDTLQLELPPATTTLELGELPKAAALEFVRTVLDEPDLPALIAEELVAKCRGNPLFLEEVGRSLRESGALEDLLNAPQAALSEAMASLEIPDRVQGLLMSRIDALPRNTRQVLRLASVLGASFAVSALQPLLDAEEERFQVEVPLGALVDSEFVVPEVDAAERRYRFRHVLIRDVAYDSLLFARRRALHHRVGEHLEATYGDQPEAWYEALAHHYGQSGNAPKTVVYTVRAGDKARGVFASEEAISYYRRGLKALLDSGGRVGRDRSYIHERIGECHELAGRYAEAAQSLTTALRGWRAAARSGAPATGRPFDLSDGRPERAREAALCYRVAVAQERRSNYDASLRWSESALRALPRGHPQLHAQILGAKSMALFRRGQYDDAIALGRRGLDLSRRRGDAREQALAHNIVAASYLMQGKLSQSVRHRSTALRLYEQADDLMGQMSAHNNLGVSYEGLGELDRALEHYHACLAAAERVGNRTWIAIAHSNIGEVLLTRGQLDEAIARFERTVATYESTGEPAVIAGAALVNLSRARMRQGDRGRSAEQLRYGFEILAGVNARGVLPLAHIQAAELALAIDDVDGAASSCERALEQSREMGMQVEEARALRLRALVAAARGQRDDAEADLRESAALARRLGAQYEHGLALLELAVLRMNSGKRRGAGSSQPLRRAEAIFRRLGAGPDLARAERAGART